MHLIPVRIATNQIEIDDPDDGIQLGSDWGYEMWHVGLTYSNCFHNFFLSTHGGKKTLLQLLALLENNGQYAFIYMFVCVNDPHIQEGWLSTNFLQNLIGWSECGEQVWALCSVHFSWLLYENVWNFIELVKGLGLIVMFELLQQSIIMEITSNKNEPAGAQRFFLWRAGWQIPSMDKTTWAVIPFFYQLLDCFLIVCKPSVVDGDVCLKIFFTQKDP